MTWMTETLHQQDYRTSEVMHEGMMNINQTLSSIHHHHSIFQDTSRTQWSQTSNPCDLKWPKMYLSYKMQWCAKRLSPRWLCISVQFQITVCYLLSESEIMNLIDISKPFINYGYYKVLHYQHIPNCFIPIVASSPKITPITWSTPIHVTLSSQSCQGYIDYASLRFWSVLIDIMGKWEKI